MLRCALGIIVNISYSNQIRIVIPVVITPLSFNKLINVNANGCWLITVRFSFKLVVIVLELFPPNSDSGDYKKKAWSC